MVPTLLLQRYVGFVSKADIKLCTALVCCRPGTDIRSHTIICCGRRFLLISVYAPDFQRSLRLTVSELGSLGEFFASIAVLVTLVFLVIQMRQNTRTMRRTNVRLSQEHNGRALSELIDEGIAEIFLRGQQSLANLSEVERYRFDLAFTMWLQSVDQAYADNREGMYPDDQLVPYENSLAAFLTTPGGEAWWKERQVWFSPAFREVVAKVCARPSAEAATAGPPGSASS